ncbi:hypothetical protein MAR_007753 [Mya arenaria]|uniref:EGF-like domain-containing protein n=1 Tax=Mya arenaria TaxID=6604 RepID=A0ABY7DX08_MYAAR|nr:hypothetical protein MAR_007753 [Mya arenaria]
MESCFDLQNVFQCRLQLAFIVAVVVQLTWYRVEAVALDATCTVTADCTATNSECTGTPLVCTCVAGYTADYSGGCSKAFDDACTAVADCSSIGGVTLCTGSKCACGANYATGTAGDFTCLAQVGATCTASGNECWTLAGGYCDTGATSPVCACGKLYTATTTCAVKACTLDSVCTTLDTNSYCLNGNCACKVGYSVNPGGTTGLCELVGSSNKIYFKIADYLPASKTARKQNGIWCWRSESWITSTMAAYTAKIDVCSRHRRLKVLGKKESSSSIEL